MIVILAVRNTASAKTTDTPPKRPSSGYVRAVTTTQARRRASRRRRLRKRRGPTEQKNRERSRPRLRSRNTYERFATRVVESRGTRYVRERRESTGPRDRTSYGRYPRDERCAPSARSRYATIVIKNRGRTTTTAAIDGRH